MIEAEGCFACTVLNGKYNKYYNFYFNMGMFDHIIYDFYNYFNIGKYYQVNKTYNGITRKEDWFYVNKITDLYKFVNILDKKIIAKNKIEQFTIWKKAIIMRYKNKGKYDINKNFKLYNELKKIRKEGYKEVDLNE